LQEVTRYAPVEVLIFLEGLIELHGSLEEIDFILIFNDCNHKQGKPAVDS